MPTLPRLGLVRVIAGGERGAYHVGVLPPDRSEPEIGAIESEPGPDRIPVWVGADGMLRLGDGASPAAGSSFGTRVRSWLDAVGRRGAYRGERDLARMAWWLRRQRTRMRVDLAADPPSGYVYVAPGDGRIPLFEGVHPTTGDQLLATDSREVEDRGYGWARLLGYIDAPVAPPATGPDGRPRVRSPATAAQPVAGDRYRPPCPGACIDEPGPLAEVDPLSTRVRGWAMFPSESVTRVELTIDGRPAGLARLALPRLDVAALCACADAPISGWEFELHASPAIPAGRPITLGGTVHGSAGRTVRLPSVTVHAAKPRVPRALDDTEAPASRSALESNGHLGSTPARRHSARTGDRLDVLVFTHSLTYGGAQLWLVELLERLSRGDLRLTLVSPADGPLRGRLERAGVAVEVFPQPGWAHREYEAHVAHLTAFAASRAFDLVIGNTVGVFYGIEVAAQLGLPSILAVHESFDPAAYCAHVLVPHDLAVFERLRVALRSASTIVFEAAATRALYLPYADPERLVAMPYGIELDAIERFRSTLTRDQARSALGLDREKKVVLCLGTMEPRKSQASLARAFAPVAERHPDALLALVGRSDDVWGAQYAEPLAEHLWRAGMQDRVLIRPLTADPFEWHVAADVLVCASDNESLPRVILEAMAFERLVVSTDIFGIPEVIEDGVTGFLCRSRDEHDISEKLSEALAMRPQHQEIRSAAAERVRRRHDAAVYAAAFRDLIDATVDERPAVTRLTP
jgi:D-inositol-3-phosphate glycosyltransferase